MSSLEPLGASVHWSKKRRTDIGKRHVHDEINRTMKGKGRIWEKTAFSILKSSGRYLPRADLRIQERK